MSYYLGLHALSISAFPMLAYCAKQTGLAFCLILKHSHALDGLFSVLSRLHGRKYKCAFC